MIFQCRVTLSLDPGLEAKLDRFLAFLDRLDEGMTPAEEAALTAAINQQADRLNAAGGPQPSAK